MVRTCGASPVCLVCLVCFVCLVDLVHLVYPVGLVQPNKRDKPNKPNNSLLTLVDFFSALLNEIYEVSRMNERPGPRGATWDSQVYDSVALLANFTICE